MKILTSLPLLAVLAAAAPLAAHAEDDAIALAKAKAFDARVFGGPVGEKASACFMRSYDARHLAQHPKQTVAAMKILLTAEDKPDEPTHYAYKIGVQFRKQPGNFDGGSSCSHFVDEDGNTHNRFSCDPDCGGAGLEIAMAKDNKSAIVQLTAISVYDRKHPDGDPTPLQSGADDKVFRLDRVDSKECDELVTDHKEVASLPQN